MNRITAAVCSSLLACTLLVLGPTPAFADEDKKCGNAIKFADVLCGTPTYSTDPYWSRTGILLYGGTDNFFYSVHPGFQWHLWDQDLNWKPAIGDFVGDFRLSGIVKKRAAFSIGGWIDDRYRHISTKEAPAATLKPIGIYAYGGIVDAVVAIVSEDATFLTSSLKLNIHGTHIPSQEYTQPKDQFDNTLKLDLVESRPIGKDEIRALMVEPKLALSFVHANQMGEGVFATNLGLGASFSYYEKGSPCARVGGRAKFVVGGPRYLDYDGWIELHVRASALGEFVADCPVFMLTSLGDDPGMLSARPGSGVNLHSSSLGAELGPSFLRGFVEVGWTWGVNAEKMLVGGGAALSFPRTWLMKIRKINPILAAMSEAEIILSGTEEGFVPRANFGATF